MNGFWKKKLPAFLLAMTLVISLVPAAGAVEDCAEGQHDYVYRMDSSGHWQECRACGVITRLAPHEESRYTDAVEPTCYQKGTRNYSCDICGYSWEEDIDATGEHVYEGASWETDSTSHWQNCTTPGCTSKSQAQNHTPRDNGKMIQPTCTASGYTEHICDICGVRYTTGTVPALGHTAPDVNGRCARCNAVIHTHSYTSGWQYDSSKHWKTCSCGAKSSEANHQDTSSPKDGYCNVCGYRMGNAAAPSTYTVTFINGGSVFSSQSGIAANSRPSNPGTPSKTAAGCTYTFQGWTTSNPGTSAMYTNQTLVNAPSVAVNQNVTYYAVYTAAAAGQNFTVTPGSSSGSTVGGDIRSQISSRFSTFASQSTFSSISFSSPSGNAYGVLYANSSRTTLGTGVSYSYADCANLYYIPGTSTNYTITYSARDSYNNTVSGTITISGSAVPAAAVITYYVAPGGTVNLNPTDFYKAYQSLSNGNSSLRYVTFHPTSSYDSFYGSLYTGSKTLTRSRLGENSFYYSSSRYGDYELSTVNFQAERTAKNGAVLTIPFQVCYSASASYEGTLKIVITNSAVAEDVVTYRVAPGGTVNLDRSDFNAVYRDVTGSSSRDIRYLAFSAPTAYTSFDGKLYAARHSDFSRSDLTYGANQFYYNSSSYGDYAIDDLSFRAGSSARAGDTLTLSFRAYYSSSDYAEGTMKIVIDKEASAGTVSYEVAPGGTVSLEREDFNDAYRTLSGNSRRTIAYVSFAAPSSYADFAGRLYADSTELTRTALTHSKTWFYYDSSRYGDYELDTVSFKADSNAREGNTLSIPFRAYYSDSDYEDGTLKITITQGGKGTIEYKVAPGGSVSLLASDFNKVYRTLSGNSSRTIRYVAFAAANSYTDFAGALYSGSTAMTRADLSYSRTLFYYSSESYGDYALDGLTFRAESTAKTGSTLTIPFRAYYTDSDYEEGALKLIVEGTQTPSITYSVAPGRSVSFDREDFNRFFRKTYSNYTLNYVVFETPSTKEFPEANGTFYSGYGSSYSIAFSRTTLAGPRFYYEEADASSRDYALGELSFAAVSAFTSGQVTLRFTAYGAGDRSVSGSVVIKPAEATASSYVGSIRYAVTSGKNVQINASDLERFFKQSYPSDTLQYVTLTGVPSPGALYYNYYSASAYGSAAREPITSASSRSYYRNPSSSAQYALPELSYPPTGRNYCPSIPFAASGRSGNSVSGSILISVTSKAVSEVYGLPPRNTAVTFPASAIYSAVSAATGTNLAGIQLLKLPKSTVGSITTGSSSQANTTTMYSYSGTGASTISQLRFTPASSFTGSVEIPYAALNSSGEAIAVGVFSLGVVREIKRFGDVNSSTWCYKYVSELADADVISGYSDGRFLPNNTVTYGAALKLIMLAAGYPEQKPTDSSSVFSGYLARARADGLITRSNVNLAQPITRLQVAQLAAGAMKLDINNLSTVKPFTDTADVYVQALNAAGIVEGYFENGTSTFKPGNTLTRGQISAIVWRMRNYGK